MPKEKKQKRRVGSVQEFIGAKYFTKYGLHTQKGELLFYLVRNKNIALSREKLLADVWGFDFYGDDRTIDAHIKMLRSHLKEYRDCIETVWGVGYKFEPKE